MSDAPPSVKRPHCAVATIVLLKEYVSGSTIVACWLVALVNGSVAMIVTATFAEAASVSVSAPTVTTASASGSRLESRLGTDLNCISLPFRGQPNPQKTHGRRAALQGRPWRTPRNK